jgi:hypothetical protein
MDLHLNLITHWTPAPGRVVEWTVPKRAAEAAAGAPVHPAAPATIQERHLRRAAANARRGENQSPWIGLAFDIDAKLDEQAMGRAIAKYVLRHETLASWFGFEDPAGDPADYANQMVRHVVPAEAVEFEPRAVDVAQTPEAIRDYVTRRFASATSALRWPSVVFGAVAQAPRAGGSESFTVFHAADHAHTDLMSMTQTFVELCELYAAEVEGRAANLPPAGSYVEFSKAERERADSLSASSPEVQAWLGHLQRIGGAMPTFPLDLGTAAGPRPAIGTRVDLLGGADSNRFAEVCKAHGGNFVGGLFAALAITERELAGRSQYFALSPMSTRNTPELMWSQGWYINLIPVAVPTAESAAFTDLVAPAQASFRSGKELGAVSVQQAIDAMAGSKAARIGTDFAGLAVPPIVSYMDGRLLAKSEDYATRRGTGLVGGKDTSIATMWVTRMANGTSIHISHPDTPEAHASVQRYSTRLAAIMAAVAHEGDYRIADPAGTVADRAEAKAG